MKAIWNSTSKMVVGGALALAIAAGAAAQAVAPAAPAAPEPPKAGEFDKPLKKARTKVVEGQPLGTSNFTYIQQDGDQSLKVTVKDDQVEAEVNGKAVPAERIKREGNTVTILDENGKPVGSPIHVGANPFGNGLTVAGGNGGIALIQPGQAASAWAPANPPPVMLGVTMSEADEGVLKHLGVEGSAIQIDTVRDGLPAAKAGLKAEDLVVSINGQSPATSQKLREILRSSKPGDELKLHVIRRGQAQDITVKLEAYDAAQLGNVVGGMEVPMGGRFPTLDSLPGLTTVPGWRNFNSDELNQELKEARAQIEEALKNVKESAKFDSDKIRQEVSAALEKAMESLSEQREKLAKEHEGLMRRWNVYTSPEGQSGRSRALVAPEQGLVLTVPQAEQNSKVEELEDRLTRMEKMLDAISKKLDEKK